MTKKKIIKLQTTDIIYLVVPYAEWQPEGHPRVFKDLDMAIAYAKQYAKDWKHYYCKIFKEYIQFHPTTILDGVEIEWEKEGN